MNEDYLREMRSLAKRLGETLWPPDRQPIEGCVIAEILAELNETQERYECGEVG